MLAVFTQHDLVIRFASDPNLSEPLALTKGIYAAMATGFVSTTGIPAIDSLFSRGGMSGMLSTVWLILGALGFGAIMEHAGFLDKLIKSVLTKAKSGGALAATVIFTAFGLNVIAADQYIAIVLPSRMFRLEFKRRGYKPKVLSRIVEDSGTVTSVLIPWNTCGAYHTGVLGISTFATPRTASSTSSIRSCPSSTDSRASTWRSTRLVRRPRSMRPRRSRSLRRSWYSSQ